MSGLDDYLFAMRTIKSRNGYVRHRSMLALIVTDVSSDLYVLENDSQARPVRLAVSHYRLPAGGAPVSGMGAAEAVKIFLGRSLMRRECIEDEKRAAGRYREMVALRIGEIDLHGETIGGFDLETVWERFSLSTVLAAAKAGPFYDIRGRGWSHQAKTAKEAFKIHCSFEDRYLVFE